MTLPLPSEHDDEVPPTTVCAVCGMPDCPGCKRPSISPTLALPWEDSATLRTLWQTADHSANEPARVFGALARGARWKPFVFAFLIETLALTSLAPVLFGIVYVVLPVFAARVFTSFATSITPWEILIAAVTGLAFLMIALHVMWAVAIEVSMRSRAGWGWNRALRFAMYSCGWDLLTSPAGLVIGTCFAGPRRAVSGMLTAATVPRAAMRAYLELGCQVPPALCSRVIRQAMRITAVVVISGMGGLAAGLLAALW